jgi:hypothetical protein
MSESLDNSMCVSGMSASSGKEKTAVSFSPELATSALMAHASFGQSNMLFPQYPQQAAAQLIRAQQWAAQWAMLFPQFSAAHQQHNNSQQLPTPTANAAAAFLPFPPQRPGKRAMALFPRHASFSHSLPACPWRCAFAR